MEVSTKVIMHIIMPRIRKEEGECPPGCCCVQTHFEEYRGQLVQYCTQNALIYPQTSGLVTTTTSTSCIAQHSKGGAVVTHLEATITKTVLLALIDRVSLTSVLFKESHGNTE